jgi:3',5'-cyclic AMP phosphodiesterase CpdA
MSTLLHLSDLHLGNPEPHQYIDDHKSPIAMGDRRAQRDVLRETLLALEDDRTLASVDAVIVSGDLTNRSDPSGFKEFPELMAPVFRSVQPENVVVVPGNHDVPWEPGPGIPGRYDGFLQATRAQRLVTPLLDGQDFDHAGPLTSRGAGPHVLEGDDFLVIPINSSNFCWGKEPLDDVAAEELLTAPASELAKLVEQLRRHDVARVSNAQIKQLLEMLRTDQPLLFQPELEDTRVRIAVLHHQLLPIGPAEELKSFESLTNLGAVRELFAQLGISIVLHGHKHESALYWDFVADRRGLDHPPHRMLVGAAPATFKARQPIGRLLHIGPRQAARDVVIEDVLAAPGPAGTPTRGSRQRARLWRRPRIDAVADAMALEGATVAEVYAQVQSVFEGRLHREPLHDLVCTITEPDDAGQVPAGYPPIRGVATPQEWMDDLVEWWQLREPQLLQHVTFNHGERIYRRWGDQVARAVRTLENGSVSTTRAVIMLLDPRTDGHPTGDFPSFVLVQLQIVARHGRRELDCTGYFRKQEMRYWWPINVAELARVQRDVVKALPAETGAVRRGTLRTITGYAAVEDKLPAVALAAIDRAVDQHPEHLWGMAYAVAHGDESEKAGVRALWDGYLLELDPTDDESSDVLTTSYRGLSDIASMIRWMKANDRPVGEALEDLIGFYASLQEQPGPILSTKSTVAGVRKRLAALRDALDSDLGPSSTP